MQGNKGCTRVVESFLDDTQRSHYASTVSHTVKLIIIWVAFGEDMMAGVIKTSLQSLAITFGCFFFCCLPAAVTSGGAAKLTGWVAFSPQFPPSSLALVFNQPCPCRQNAWAWWLVQSLKSLKDLKASVGVTEEEDENDLIYCPSWCERYTLRLNRLCRTWAGKSRTPLKSWFVHPSFED